MDNVNWTLVAAAALSAGLLVLGLASPRGHGSAWDDQGPDGHSALAQRLADSHPVFAIESSLALLPEGNGEDALFLFPTHRPATPAELARVQAFLQRGGLVVVAADGGHADTWADAFGVRFKGLPALLPPGVETDCMRTDVPFEGMVHGVCLPSPTTFPDLANLTTGDVAFRQVSYSLLPVFLDADLDGHLGTGDQGPVVSPLVLQWDVGEGRVVAVADGDAWRNGLVADHPSNLEFAHALAASSDRVFLDTSGVQPQLSDRIANPAYRTLAGPALVAQAGLALFLLGLALAVGRIPRVAPLRVHDPPRDAVDADVARAAARTFKDHFAGSSKTVTTRKIP